MLATPELIYPIRVTFNFDYKGMPHQVSYTTLMRKGLCDLKMCIFRWNPGRDKFATLLPDGSLLILKPLWPLPWEEFESGRIYPLGAKWLWVNRRVAPTQIVTGDGALQLASDHPLFTWMSANVTIERLNELHSFYAITSDNEPDDSARLLYSSTFGGSFTSTGRLFAGVEAAPLQGAGLANVRSLAEWISLANGCRVLPWRAGSKLYPEVGRELVTNRVLLHDDDLWSYDGGPRPGEAYAMYPSGNAEASDMPQLYRSALHEVHELEFDDKKCTGIELPLDCYEAYVDLGDGRIVGLFPSPGFVVLRD